MSEVVQKSRQAVDERYGVPVYQASPSIPSEAEIKRSKRAQIGNDVKGLVVDTARAEILGHGGAIAYAWEEVGKERFVKLYLGATYFDSRAEPTVTRHLARRLKALGYDVHLQPRAAA